MEESIVTAYRHLLTCVCADGKRLGVVVEMLGTEISSRKSRRFSDVKAVANVHKALKGHQIGMAVNILKLKTNEEISDKVLTYIAVLYDCPPLEAEGERHTPDCAEITDKTAIGFLAYFILEQDEAGCAALLKRVSSEKKEPLEDRKAPKKEVNNEEADKKLKRENAKLIKKIALLEQKHTDLCTELEQQLYAAVVARDEAERLAVEHARQLQVLREALCTQTQRLEAAQKTATQQKIETEKLQEKILHLEDRLLAQAKEQAPKREIYFIGDPRGLPQEGEYQFTLGSRDEKEDWEAILHSGLSIWVVLLEVPFATKRKAKKYSEKTEIQLFESKQELIQFVRAGEKHGV